ncbi:MAG: tail fiber domain-containing protein [Draconibacterium sp.]|nr:tail fiber domain-containing protein [Draconibacterium sp.]
MYFTRDDGDVFAYYKFASGNKFTFNCNLVATSITLTSDKRLKTNINKLGNTLDMLTKLEGVSYILNP